MTKVDCVYVVDEDLSARKGLTRLVRTAGYDVRDFASINDFVNALTSEAPGCVVLDAGISGQSGEQLQAKLKLCGLHVPIIVVTTHDDLETRRQAEKMNATAFFRKPVDGTALLDAIEWAIRSRSRDSNHEKS